MSELQKIENLIEQIKELSQDDSKKNKMKIANKLKDITSLTQTLFLIYSKT
jgi:hypothetical protein